MSQKKYIFSSIVYISFFLSMPLFSKKEPLEPPIYLDQKKSETHVLKSHSTTINSAQSLSKYTSYSSAFAGVLATIQYILSLKKDKITLEECNELINKDNFLQETYQTIESISLLISKVNHNNLAIKITARLELLRSCLPQPFQKTLEKCLKKFASKCTNRSGKLINIASNINTKKIFKGFFKKIPQSPQEFIKKSHKLKNNFIAPSSQLTYINQSRYNKTLLDIIYKNLSDNYPEFTKLCRENWDQIVEQLYNYYTEEIIKKKTTLSKSHSEYLQDPLVRKNIKKENFSTIPEKMKPDIILRSFYQKELESWLVNAPIHTTPEKDITYDSLGKPSSIQNIPLDPRYRFTLLHNFVTKVCSGIDTCSSEIQQTFFHPSGILKKYINHPYVKQYLLHHTFTTREAHQCINYALAIQDKEKDPITQEIANQIIKYTHSSLECDNPQLMEAYQQQATQLLEKLIHPKITKLEKQKSRSKDDIYTRYDSKELFSTHVYSLEQKERECERIDAFNISQSELFKHYNKNNNIDPEVKGFMLAHGINPYLFYNMKGTSFQHHITFELLEIIKQCSHKNHSLLPHIAEFADTAQTYNRSEKIIPSIKATDICWSMLKYVKAIGMGCKDTVDGFIDIAIHPMTSLCNAGKNIASLTYNLGEYAFDATFQPLKAINKENELSEKIYCFYNNISKMWQESSGPERTRFVTHLITDQYLSRKSLMAVGNLCKAGANLITKAPKKSFFSLFKKAPTVQLAAETHIADSAYFYLQNIEKIKSESSSIFATIEQAKQSIPFVHSFEKQFKNLKKKYKTVQTIFQGKAKEVHIRLQHILQPTIQCKKNNIASLRLTGWHHDFKNYIESHGKIAFIKKTLTPQGCYVADIVWKGDKVFTKTFFPAQWTPEKVIQKIIEASENSKIISSHKNRIIALGKTTEKIMIQLHLEKHADYLELISAYPCKKWIESLRS